MLVSMLSVSTFAAEGEQGAFTLPAPELHVLEAEETIGNQSFKAGMIVLANIPESLPNFCVEIKKTGPEGEPFEFYSDGFGGVKQSVQEIYIGWYDDGMLESGAAATDAESKLASLPVPTRGGSGSSKPVAPDVPTTPDRPEVPAIDASERFGDIAKDAWSADHVSYVVSRGLMNGMGGGSFAPDAQLSRAMLAQILYNYSDRPAVGGESPFADVGSGWYADAVIWAAENGVVQGDIDGTFAPTAAVTWGHFCREDPAKSAKRC